MYVGMPSGSVITALSYTAAITLLELNAGLARRAMHQRAHMGRKQ
jgi:hypothetical protein